MIRPVAVVAGLVIAMGSAGCAGTDHAAGPVRAAAEIRVPGGPVTAYVLSQGAGTVTPISTRTSTAGPAIRIAHALCCMAIEPFMSPTTALEPSR